MEKAQIERMLLNYRETKGRLSSLMVQIGEVGRMLIQAMNSMIDDEVLSSAANDGQPHGNSVGSMVESIAVRYADGYLAPDVRELKQQYDALMLEVKRCESLIAYVDGWMKALPEKQRFVLQHQVIDGESWKEVVRKYREKFANQEGVSKDRLKYTKAKAIDAIFNMAGGSAAILAT